MDTLLTQAQDKWKDSAPLGTVCVCVVVVAAGWGGGEGGLAPWKTFPEISFFPLKARMHQKGEPLPSSKAGATVGRTGLCPGGGRLTGPQCRANSLSMGQRYLLSTR